MSVPDTRDWAAWIDRMPGPDNDNPTLHVTGVCSFPTEGWSAQLVPVDGQDPDAEDFHLRLVTWPPAEGAAEVLTDVEVAYAGLAATAATSISIEMVAETLPVGDVF